MTAPTLATSYVACPCHRKLAVPDSLQTVAGILTALCAVSGEQFAVTERNLLGLYRGGKDAPTAAPQHQRTTADPAGPDPDPGGPHGSPVARKAA
jgi:hypothetical protein